MREFNGSIRRLVSMGAQCREALLPYVEAVGVLP
jgi:hypothetical protein